MHIHSYFITNNQNMHEIMGFRFPVYSSKKWAVVLRSIIKKNPRLLISRVLRLFTHL